MTIETQIELVEYALAKQIPDIAARTVFETSYGTLRLDHEESRKIGTFVEKLFKTKFEQLRRNTQM